MGMPGESAYFDERDMHGKVVRIDLNLFSAEGVEVVDLSTCHRMQIPNAPDPDLKGYMYGFAAGNFAYFVPHFNGKFFGKMARFDMRDFGDYAARQKAGNTTDYLSPYG